MGRPQPPPSLVKYLKEGRCVLFAGAGLSRWAGLPTWPKLIEDMFAEVRQEKPEGPEAVAELERLIADRKYLEVADHCKERLKQRYAAVLSELLQAGKTQLPEPHRLIMRMPFAAWVTTNYDQLLEKAYVVERNDWPKIYTHLDTKNFGTLLLDDAPFILKAHGDIDKPDSLVLTARDYCTIIHANPAFNAFFSALLLTRTVLFVGYSLTDPDFRLMFDRQLATFQGEVPERFALMSGVGDIESQILDRTAGIRVLSYDHGDHEAVLKFLQTLHDQVRPAPTAPAPVATPTALEASPMLPQEAWQLSLKTGIRGIAAALTCGTHAETVWEEGGPVDWAALLHSLSTLGSGCGVQVGEQDFEEIGRLLAAGLPVGVVERLRLALDEVESGGAPARMVLRLTPELDRLPWELTRVGNRPLALGCLLVRAPVGISDAARGLRAIRSPAKALLVADPDGSLPGAREEVRRISRLYRDAQVAQCTCLFGEQATVDEVLRAFETGDYDVVHFAGHAWYDAHEVYLALSGGTRLTACMLRPALNRHPPAIMVLNSHFTAFVPLGVGVIPDGEEEQPIKPSVAGRVGFAELAMRTGVGAFVGCFGSPSDPGARDLGFDLHRGLLRGEGVAEALCGARQRLAQERPSDPTPHLYVLNGYPDLRF